MNEDLLGLLIGVVLSVLLALVKLTMWASLSWFWVLVPLMVCTGFVLLIVNSDTF